MANYTKAAEALQDAEAAVLEMARARRFVEAGQQVLLAGQPHTGFSASTVDELVGRVQREHAEVLGFANTAAQAAARAYLADMDDAFWTNIARNAANIASSFTAEMFAEKAILEMTNWLEAAGIDEDLVLALLGEYIENIEPEV